MARGWISRWWNAGKYGKSDETGAEDAASDGRTGKRNGDERLCNPQAAEQWK